MFATCWRLTIKITGAAGSMESAKMQQNQWFSLRVVEEIWLMRARISRFGAIREHRSRSLARNYSVVKIIRVINQ
jgi:hypothetical protein